MKEPFEPEKSLENRIIQAVDAEKRRIGRDLHDGIGQHLAGVAYRVAALSELLEGRSARRLADELLGLVDEAIRDVRNIAKGLHPVEPGPNGLLIALSLLAERIRSAGVAVDLRIPCALVPVSIGAATAIFRIAEESVTNALKHARPRYIELSLSIEGCIARLEVRDQGGRGASRTRVTPGLGEQIMGYRANELGGRLTIVDTAMGRSVSLVVPLARNTGMERKNDAKEKNPDLRRRRPSYNQVRYPSAS